jgi:hypothetical protein
VLTCYEECLFDRESKMATRKCSRQIDWLITAVVLGAAGILAACGSPATPTPTAPPATPTVLAPTPVSFNDLWKSSKHADARAAAFTHWNNANPQQIPANCSRCHSRPGFIDFLGVDGTAVGVVDKPAPVGTTITCYVCHNEASPELDTATFPSGKTISGLGRSEICLECHQGRASTETVDDAILNVAPANDDTVSAKFVFISSHHVSGATSFGSEVQGAYEYAGKSYQGRYLRGGVFFDCLRCHDPHTQKVKVETCAQCHTIPGGDPKNIRVNTTDFAGDGNLQEGVSAEITHIQDKLYAAIRSYAKNTVGSPIAYDLKTHPYFFNDSNANGKVDPGENVTTNQYNAWTARLLRAAYNYNYVSHDPGAFAHNSTYVIQVLYDSLADIGGDVSGMKRP